MAGFNSIGLPWMSSGVPRLYGVDMPRVTQVSGDVQIVTSPFELPEQWALLGGGLAAGQANVTAAANPNVGLYNPPNSGVLIVVENFHLYNANGANGGFVVYLYKGFLSGSSGNWQNRDTRRVSGVQASGGLVGQLMFQDMAGNPAGIAIIGRVGILGAATYEFNGLNAILAPGWMLGAAMLTAAGTLYGSYFGRERPVPASELSL